jgi:integrase/recombinase XerD
MLRTNLRASVIDLCRARVGEGLVSDCLGAFAEWLDQLGYRPATISAFLQSLPAWINWMHDAGLAGNDFRTGLDAYRLQIEQRTESRRRSKLDQTALRVASRFIDFLEERQIIGQGEPPLSPIVAWPLLGEFCAWAREHQGLTESTLDLYQGILIGLVETIGIIPTSYTPEKLRSFVLQRARSHGIKRARTIVTAVRAFLRFLGATGRCPAGMEYAIPGFAAWRLSEVPKFLEPGRGRATDCLLYR